MRVAGRYSFNGGRDYVEEHYPELLAEVIEAIRAIDSRIHKTKESEEKTMRGRTLYSPPSLNAAFKEILYQKGWAAHRERCDYPTQFYEEGYTPPATSKGAFREMDFVKQKLGVEVQFGKYSFMVYNVAAKMTIFRNLGIIDAGIEIVPVRSFAEDFSSGVSYYEQFLWDLEKRGVSNIDVPVLVIGIDSTLDAGAEALHDWVQRAKVPRKGAAPGPKGP